MPRKSGNRSLWIVFGLLCGIFILILLFRSLEKGSSFRKEFPAIDSAAVTAILLNPQAEHGAEIRFEKKEGKWKVRMGTVLSEPREQSVERMLFELENLKIDRIAGRGRDKWNAFQVGDNEGSRVRVVQGNDTVLDFIVGKFEFETQPGQTKNGLGGNPELAGTTYIRLTAEEETYFVRGFLSFTFNGEFSAFRNARFLDFNDAAITAIEYHHEAGDFRLEKKDSVWMLEGKACEPKTLRKLERALTYRQNSNFFDGELPDREPDRFIRIHTQKGIDEIKAWREGENEWLLSSSQNPEARFRNPEQGLMEEIFLSREEAMKGRTDEVDH